METILERSSHKHKPNRRLSITGLCVKIPSSNKLAPHTDNTFEFQTSAKEGIFRGSDFEKDFEQREKLGEGYQSIVRRAIQRSSGRQYAVKIMTGMDDQMMDQTKKQFSLLKNLQFSSIVKVQRLYIFEKEGECRMVMELCQFAELRQLMRKQGRLTQTAASGIIKSLLEAVEYVHNRGICHRDLKPENILYCPETGQMKLIDFNIATQSQEMISQCGTITYNAPEMLAGIYDNKIDVWAIGVIAYEMLHGTLPFYHELRHETIEQIRAADIDSIMDEQLSQLSKDFLRKCLNRNSEERLTTTQALAQPFIMIGNSKSPSSASTTASQCEPQSDTEKDNMNELTCIESPTDIAPSSSLSQSDSPWKSMALLCGNLGLLTVALDF